MGKLAINGGTPIRTNLFPAYNTIGEEEKKETLKALGAAAGFFRWELAQRLKLRSIPEISFHWDDSIERGELILQLIDSIHAEKTSPT